MRAILREATGEMHERLHGAPIFARLASGELDRSGYGRLLQHLARFHHELEPTRARGARALGLPVANPRLPLLAADLESVGCTAPFTSVAEGNADWSVGCFYVVEGSTVGGRLLHRQLDALFGASLEGRRFFAGDANAARNWRRSCAALDTYVPDDPAQVVAGAVASFGRFAHKLPAEI